jgi:hypothetical protein
MAPAPAAPAPGVVRAEGAGKTSLALEHAHRHLGEVGLAWQFAAEDPAMLKAEFAELAAQLGARDLLDVRDPVASVHGALAAYLRDWLLVLTARLTRPWSKPPRTRRQRGHPRRIPGLVPAAAGNAGTRRAHRI